MSTFGFPGIGEEDHARGEVREEGYFQKSSLVTFDFMDSLAKIQEVKQAI